LTQAAVTAFNVLDLEAIASAMDRFAVLLIMLRSGVKLRSSLLKSNIDHSSQ